MAWTEVAFTPATTSIKKPSLQIVNVSNFFRQITLNFQQVYLLRYFELNTKECKGNFSMLFSFVDLFVVYLFRDI